MIDLASEVLLALQSQEGRAAIGDGVRAVVREEVRAALAEREERLLPLPEVLGCTPAAARMRLRRDPALRQLGIPIGRRILFKRSDVEHYYKAR